MAEFGLANPWSERRADPNGYYAVLGLDVRHPWLMADIRSAFREKAKLYHPDGQQPNSEKFELLHIAYEVLSDPESRANYDSLDGSSQLLDAVVLEYIRSKLTGIKTEMNVVEVVKDALKTKTPQPPHEALFTDYAYYCYEEEPAPSQLVRDAWIALIKKRMWEGGMQGQEVKVGFTTEPAHVLIKPWGKVLMCGTGESPSSETASDMLQLAIQ